MAEELRTLTGEGESTPVHRDPTQLLTDLRRGAQAPPHLVRLDKVMLPQGPSLFAMIVAQEQDVERLLQLGWRKVEGDLLLSEWTQMQRVFLGPRAVLEQAARTLLTMPSASRLTGLVGGV